jgi:hypothetical protein
MPAGWRSAVQYAAAPGDKQCHRDEDRPDKAEGVAINPGDGRPADEP